MIKKFFTLVLACGAVVVLSGCYTVRTYVVNKDRVDQDIPGQPNNGPVKTRKVIVLEVVEKDKPHPALADEVKAPAVSVPAAKNLENNFALPQSAPAVEKVPVTAPVQDYVVEKDDTLQKISKKVYGSYSKWTRIYDANRDVIKDPNFMKPGLTLKIPALETPTTTENK